MLNPSFFNFLQYPCPPYLIVSAGAYSVEELYCKQSKFYDGTNYGDCTVCPDSSLPMRECARPSDAVLTVLIFYNKSKKSCFCKSLLFRETGMRRRNKVDREVI